MKHKLKIINDSKLLQPILFIFLIFSCLILSACTAPLKEQQPGINYKPAVSDKTAMQKTVTRYVPVAMPGQLMPVNKKNHVTSSKLKGIAAIKTANKKALTEPASSGYINAIMTFNFMPGALYQIYCAPLNVTDIQFAPGEKITSVAAGDTLRWQVSKTYSGENQNHYEHLVIKPIEANLTNSMVITTNQRTYHLQLHSTDQTYMASVKWNYPDEDNGNFVKSFTDNQVGTANNQAAIDTKSLNLNQLHFSYKAYVIKGRRPQWMPIMIFNDGNKTYIKFPSNIQESPTLFIGNGIKNAQLMNYRVVGDYYIIDGIFSYMQLRIGQKNQTIVQINYVRK